MSKKKSWFKIDNAGKIYPSIMSTRVSTVYRLSVTLKNRVHPKILQEALDITVPRFPYFHVNMRRGFFWYYFVHSQQRAIVEEERYDPCMFMYFKNRKKLPYRVLYFKNKISLEMSHSITDGTGSMTFFKTLIVEYFRLLGIKSEPIQGIFDVKSAVDLEEYEDAFQKYYNKHIPFIEKLPNAMHFPFDMYPKGVYSVVTGIVDSDKLYKIAKLKYGVTVTQFLVGLYFSSIQDYLYDLPPRKRRRHWRPICINVPVNLRGLYPTKTLRNFFISLIPSIDPRLGKYSFEEILTYVTYYMEMHINKRYISQYLSRNVRNEKSWYIRIIPLNIKDLLMPTIYHKYGERSYTSSISNLGIVKMPKELEPYIERFEMYPPPSKGSKIKVGVVAFKDKTYINFGSIAVSREIEKYFFRKLRKMGLHVKIETNH
ncbi:hypothetical protein [Vallitalea okinawensis]|uniref:hypothetical protein n=1 Tax=Vallitalea okinawensis TaxID=2078660 RepID=UPI000CFE30CA|nr:hypothetical protein [Vallitalea okinawensis]